MPFPKFTSGRSGRLTFDTLNELFSRVEALEGNSDRKPWSIKPPSDAFFAKAGIANPSNPDQSSFTEVTRIPGASSSPLDPASWIDVTGGRNSSGYLPNNTISQFAYPLVGTGLSQGSIYPVVSTFNSEGDLIYVPIVSSGVSSSFPAKITTATPISTNLRWRYTCLPQRVQSSGNDFENVPNASAVQAINGAEVLADASPVFGVGMQPPQSGTLQMIRQPIRVGIIVTLTLDAGGRHSFSMPNGYKVIC